MRGEQDLAQTMVGTPYYISPEICEDKPYGQKSDIWALGCCFFELLTGRRPFEANSLPSLMRRIVEDKPPPLSASVSPDVAHALEWSSPLLRLRPVRESLPRDGVD
jgi:NIMA (never in mitosis gene a)-related kinase